MHLDELSSTVLCLGLPGDAHTPTGRMLAAMRGEPASLTLRQLRRHTDPNLLELLSEGGADFDYHGDFDWGGIGIATAVHTRIGWRPWRYDATAYRKAISTTPLTGHPVPTPWDPSLSTAMKTRASA